MPMYSMVTSVSPFPNPVRVDFQSQTEDGISVLYMEREAM